MPILWDILNLDTQQKLATKYKLSVYLVKTQWGIELRLRGYYYGDEETIEEIEYLMKIPAHYKMAKLAKG